ncbi:MAG: hypothetical protein BWK79_00810 [Beggiatoa sp. IS2]|nr:MAG: hypothetical protein BWK79_00810 [Beggiatoa sp. IS2]
MQDISEKIDTKGLRDFGLMTGGLFVVLFGIAFPWLFSTKYPGWPWLIAIILTVFALTIPNALRPVYRVWMAIGQVLGRINTWIILAILFYLIFTPMGFLMRLIRKNLSEYQETLPNSYRRPADSRPAKHMERPF